MKIRSDRPCRWLVGLLLLMALPQLRQLGWAQPAAPPNGALNRNTPPVSAPGDQRQLSVLGPGDQVNLQVYGQPDMTTAVYVGDDGTVSVPLTGAVRVAGLTPVEAAHRIEKALSDGQFLIDPHVTVSILQAHSQRVSVLGAVRTPGRYAIDPGTRFLDLLAEAGGVTEDAGDLIYVERTESDGTSRRFQIDLRDVTAHGPAAERPEAGDSIVVPRAEQFYVYGEVARPDKYRLEPGMTVIQAISRAGGVTPRGSERRAELKRMGPDGKYIIRKAGPNDLLQANDVLRVKESIF